ncbi:MAG: hypothetical protein K0Q66_434 [Chitinophagaceae bacterium]|jgi:hypothetical protein|nr:hypothetical protein [Chitinophagaceae bacterium]
MPGVSLTIRILVLFAIVTIALSGEYRALTASFITPSNEGAGKNAGTFKERLVATTLSEYARWNNGALRETDSRAAEILRAYWEMGTVGVPTNEELSDSIWQENRPWSAVFISWIMKQAGAGNTFRYAHAHANYIAWARDNAPGKSAFVAYDVKDRSSAWPEPGDLICMNREKNQHTLQDLQPYHASHCDVVVEVNREMNMMITIGGNLAQTVNKRIVWLDVNGHVDAGREWMVMDDENPYKGGQEDIFAIIKVSPQPMR